MRKFCLIILASLSIASCVSGTPYIETSKDPTSELLDGSWMISYPGGGAFSAAAISTIVSIKAPRIIDKTYAVHPFSDLEFDGKHVRFFYVNVTGNSGEQPTVRAYLEFSGRLTDTETGDVQLEGAVRFFQPEQACVLAEPAYSYIPEFTEIDCPGREVAETDWLAHPLKKGASDE